MENRIKERIKEAHVVQKELAEKLGMTPIAVSALASKKMPKIETFVKIAKALGVPTWSLLLSDDEIAEIRAAAPKHVHDNSSDRFQCPVCGASLNVRPADSDE